MELPLHFPSPLSPVSSAAGSYSTSTPTSTTAEMERSPANALRKAWDEQSAHSCTTSSASNQHQLYQCQLQAVYDEQVRSKKRKLASSMQEEAHLSTMHRLHSPLRKVDNQYCHGVKTSEDDQMWYEEKRSAEEELVGCATPPYVQSTYNAAHDHNCSIMEVNLNEDPIDADLAELHAQTSTLIGENQVSYKRDISLRNGDGIQSMCGCSIRRSGPPLAPRKPKAKPRVFRSNCLNFFIPPDLELFFSSTSPPQTEISKQANHDTQN